MNDKIELARQAYRNAYAKYSNFQVGAVVFLKNGAYVMGSNIENAAYGLTNCAERSALFSAYSQGFRKDDITEMLVIAKGARPVSPCGACRQVMVELMNPETPVVLANLTGEYITLQVKELLPYYFNAEDLHDGKL